MMDGRVVGSYRIGRGLKEKRVPLSTLRESGLLILMIKVFRRTMMPSITPYLQRYQSIATRTELLCSSIL
ncbi:hypothetical protein CsSME_00034522 [Camellia sinensis var. sinensis]